MNRETTLDEFGATRTVVERARHTAGQIYTSLEILEREKERLFLKDWLCVGRVEEFKQAGDYRAMRLFEEPVLIVRDERGTLNAFSNVCLHRGVEVAAGSGNVKEFMCPYHGWLYDWEGRLVGAPYMKEAEGFDPKSCRLPRLSLDTWAGWVFVSFDPAPAPLVDQMGPFASTFDVMRQQDLSVAYSFELEFDCNWKFIYENLLDFYHADTLHAATIGAYYVTDRSHYNLLPRGGFVTTYKTKTQVDGGKPLFGPIAWIADKGEEFAINGYLPPNFSLFARCDNINGYITWPLGTDRCRMICYHLIPKAFFDDPAYAAKIARYREFQQRVLEEDRGMIASLQRAMRSRHFVPGPMSVREVAIHHAINNHLDRVFAP
ncbi:MAG: aromatic ring-hydroxylating dioxygenase subunit alpha [Alphaproteobacteria bacterium]|nr:aromatic ring-hydroxylating dioxygenase subunit alpha [Alphaproteobacteria bacterium]